MRSEIMPKNILMIGTTGVGKTEIARRLAKLAHAPFIKVEATKFTEVGYVGRDVESIIRDLVDVSIKMLRGIKERFASVADEMESAICMLPVNGKPTEFDLTEPLREACRRMVPPIVEGLGQLVSTFDPEFQERLKDRVNKLCKGEQSCNG